MSGQEVPDLPSNNGDPKAPYYVDQFIDCIIQFWQKGGSLVLMGENDPHNFQVNLFLEKVVFNGDKKVDFKIKGNHPGRKILIADDSGELKNKKSFNSKIQEVNNVERKSLANNLVQIFEGATVAFVQGGSIDPFIPFSRDSDGGINSLFYNGVDRGDGTGEGDIFIDAAYTKFFLDMKKTGTERYLQNIGGFIGSAERRYKTGEHPRLYRPDQIFFELKKDSAHYYKFPLKQFDVLYLVDATGSMGGTIKKVKQYCVEIADVLRAKMASYDFRFGAVFYRDPVHCPRTDRNDYYDFTDNTRELQKFVEGMRASGGGGDGAEDWYGAYEITTSKLHWRNGIRLAIHIADDGAHGKQYSSRDGHPDEGPKLDEIYKKVAKMNINIVGFKIGDDPSQSFNRSKELLKSYGMNNYKISEFDQDKKDPRYFTDLVVDAVTHVT